MNIYIAIIGCIIWGILLVGDTVSFFKFHQIETLTLRLILAELVCFLLYLAQWLKK